MYYTEINSVKCFSMIVYVKCVRLVRTCLVQKTENKSTNRSTTVDAAAVIVTNATAI